MSAQCGRAEAEAADPQTLKFDTEEFKIHDDDFKFKRQSSTSGSARSSRTGHTFCVRPNCGTRSYGILGKGRARKICSRMVQ